MTFFILRQERKKRSSCQHRLAARRRGDAPAPAGARAAPAPVATTARSRFPFEDEAISCPECGAPVAFAIDDYVTDDVGDDPDARSGFLGGFVGSTVMLFVVIGGGSLLLLIALRATRAQRQSVSFLLLFSGAAVLVIALAVWSVLSSRQSSR